jgi:hypothetical protein
MFELYQLHLVIDCYIFFYAGLLELATQAMLGFRSTSRKPSECRRRTMVLQLSIKIININCKSFCATSTNCEMQVLCELNIYLGSGLCLSEPGLYKALRERKLMFY